VVGVVVICLGEKKPRRRRSSYLSSSELSPSSKCAAVAAAAMAAAAVGGAPRLTERQQLALLLQMTAAENRGSSRSLMPLSTCVVQSAVFREPRKWEDGIRLCCFLAVSGEQGPVLHRTLRLSYKLILRAFQVSPEILGKIGR